VAQLFSLGGIERMTRLLCFITFTAVAVQICLLGWRVRPLTRAIVWRRTFIAAIITGIIWWCFFYFSTFSSRGVSSEHTPSFTDEFVVSLLLLMPAFLFSFVAMIPAAGVALIYIRLFCKTHENAA
jgi:hypothetical protein